MKTHCNNGHWTTLRVEKIEMESCHLVTSIPTRHASKLTATDSFYGQKNDSFVPYFFHITDSERALKHF